MNAENRAPAATPLKVCHLSTLIGQMTRAK